MEILYTKYIHKFKFKYSENPAQIGGNGNGLYANSDDGEGFEQAIFIIQRYTFAYTVCVSSTDPEKYINLILWKKTSAFQRARQNMINICYINYYILHGKMIDLYIFKYPTNVEEGNKV